MAVAIPDYRTALRFLHESAAWEAIGPAPGSPEVPHRGPPAAALLPAPFPGWADEPAAGCRVFAAGWTELEGVMLLQPETEFPADFRAALAARHDRALIDLLRALPPGQVIYLFVAGKWARDTLAYFLEGRVIACGSGVCSFRGIKRGSGRCIDLPDAEFFGRPRDVWAGSGPPCREAGRITGSKDPLLARFRELMHAAGRRERTQFVAEGFTLVERAVDDGLPVEAIVFTPDLTRQPEGERLLSAARAAGLRHDQISEGLMGTITTTRPVPPVAAAVGAAIREAPPVPRAAASPLLIAERINNPDNLGMVLRTADAAGAAAVILAGEKTDPTHKNCVRAARGAVGRLPLFLCPDLASYLARLRQAGFHVLAATGRADRDFYSCDLRPPLALVVGNEQEGVSPAVLDAAGESARIPMAPGQDSLNVGVAAGVLLYEAMRQTRRFRQN